MGRFTNRPLVNAPGDPVPAKGSSRFKFKLPLAGFLLLPPLIHDVIAEQRFAAIWRSCAISLQGEERFYLAQERCGVFALFWRPGQRC